MGSVMPSMDIDRRADLRMKGCTKTFVLGLLGCVFMTGLPKSVLSESLPEERVAAAKGVLEELFQVPERGIPEEMLSRCYALAVFPSVYKGGFILGASYGKGLIVVRDMKTGLWRGPAFLTLGSGSIGWQLGFHATDLVLVVMNRNGVESFLQNNVTLGGDISVAAGPVGRGLKAATDIQLKSEVYSYSRSKGFFVGASLEGAAISQDYEANERFYGRPLMPREILLSGKVAWPWPAQELHRLLEARKATP